MHVVATAGHVDHGKSTLVRALTGMEPDRWAEERRRGMTIDLGYAWAGLPSGATLAFVDVPGHQRFIGNMLAGLGPAPAVLFVVAADEGWRPQSGEHLEAVDALGLRHGLLAVTRADLADPGPATAEALELVAGSSLGEVEAVAVSAVTGAGVDALRAALDRLVARLPDPRADGRVRLWVDRVFTVRGSGTVVTGTLGAGTLHTGGALELHGRPVRVRALQSLGRPVETATAVARVAVNLRDVGVEDVGRGDALLTAGAWRPTVQLDVRLDRDPPAGQLVLHVGSAAVPAHVRPLGGGVARLRLHRPLPLERGDRALLRDPGAQRMAGGVEVLDVDPPALRRRGSARARGEQLRAGAPDLDADLERRGAVRLADLRALGHDPSALTPVLGDWVVTARLRQEWAQALLRAVDEHARREPLAAGLPAAVAARALALPTPALLPVAVSDAGLEATRGLVRRPGSRPDLGAAEAAVRELEERLAADPYAAPERPELDRLGLRSRELAAAETAGRLVRLAEDVVLLPAALGTARERLAALPQPFTLSQARQALGTTRRVAVPLLERLDVLGHTVRVDASLRRVAAGEPPGRRVPPPGGTLPDGHSNEPSQSD